jgi:hypothetical protein
MKREFELFGDLDGQQGSSSTNMASTSREAVKRHRKQKSDEKPNALSPFFRKDKQNNEERYVCTLKIDNKDCTNSYKATATTSALYVCFL